jgi:hypothetical protein
VWSMSEMKDSLLPEREESGGAYESDSSSLSSSQQLLLLDYSLEILLKPLFIEIVPDSIPNNSFYFYLLYSLSAHTACMTTSLLY